MWRILKAIASGTEIGNVTTLADPSVVDKLLEERRICGPSEASFWSTFNVPEWLQYDGLINNVPIKIIKDKIYAIILAMTTFTV